MDSVGELLRSERLRQGLDLTQIAERTRIGLNFLEAIESGATESLPGAFFYRAFARQYAQELGLSETDLEPALSDFRVRTEAAQPLPSPQSAPPPIELPPIPVSSARRRFSGPRPSAVILLVAVIGGCSGIYALWQRTQRGAAARPAPSVAQKAPVQTQAAPPPQPQGVPTPPPEAPKPVQQPAAAPPEPPVPDAKLSIEVEAFEPVWYSATTDSGKTSSILKPGQTRRFASSERAVFFVGNAGGIEIRVNGKSIGPIGARGHLKTVVITPEGSSITNPREQ